MSTTTTTTTTTPSTLTKPSRTLMVSQTAGADPQMQLPERPKLAADLQPVWLSSDCLVLLGGPQAVTLRGQSVGSLLPLLLPLLDGRRTVAELALQLPRLSRASLEQALRMLFMRGVLVGPIEGAAATPQLDSAAPRWRTLRPWLERYLDVTRVFRSADAVIATMQDSSLLLLSDSPYALEVLRSLKELGLGHALLVGPDAHVLLQAAELADPHFELQLEHSGFAEFLARVQEPRLKLGPAGDRMAALVAKSPALDAAMRLSQQDYGRRMLYAVLGMEEVRIGPALDLPVSTCLSCAQQSGVFDGEALSRDQGFLPHEVELGAVRCGHKLFELMTRFMPVQSMDQSELLSPDSLLFEAKPVMRQFSCPCCSRSSKAISAADGVCLGGEQRAPMAWFYHRQSQHEAYQMAPKGHQEHYASKHKKSVAGAYKLYRSLPRLSLPELPKLPDGEPAKAGEHAFARLSELLRLALSRRVIQTHGDTSVALRLTPSGGSMASQNVYVLAYTGEPEQQGLFFFDPNGHWQRLARQAPAWSQIWLGGVQREQPQYLLVLSSSHARLESKYRNVAYRYAHYDAGALLASLQWLAPQGGFAASSCANFDDGAFAQLFDASELNEFVTAVLLLDAPAAAAV